MTSAAPLFDVFIADLRAIWRMQWARISSAVYSSVSAASSSLLPL